MLYLLNPILPVVLYLIPYVFSVYASCTSLLSNNVVEKFRKVSDSVWVSFEAVSIENTLKEESTNKNNFDDNIDYKIQ